MMRYTTPACVCFPIFEAPLVASPERLGWPNTKKEVVT